MTIKPQKKMLFPKRLSPFSFAVFAFGFFLLSGNFVMAQESGNEIIAVPVAVPFSEIQKIDLDQEKDSRYSFLNFENVKIVQNGRDFDIKFDLRNGKGAQAQIKYGVEVGVRQDFKLFSETLDLGEGGVVTRSISYTAPKMLEGKNVLFLTAYNASGLELAKYGKNIELGKEEIIDGVLVVNSECYLTVAEETSGKKYTLLQGVDVREDETLNINCLVKNLSKKEIVMYPYFENYRRNIYGGSVDGNKGEDAVKLSEGENKNISLKIPKAVNPQAYDAVLSFVDGTVQRISNIAVAHFILIGRSATIQNVVLDKDYYSSGDTAKVSFLVSFSADDFRGSRYKTVANNDLSIMATINRKDGEACSGVVQKKMVKNEFGLQDMMVPVTSTCENPSVSLVIKDNQTGESLDAKEYQITSKRESGNLFGYPIAVLVFLLLLGFTVVLFKRRHGWVLFFFLLVFYGFSFSVLRVSAYSADYSLYSEGPKLLDGSDMNLGVAGSLSGTVTMLHDGDIFKVGDILSFEVKNQSCSVSTSEYGCGNHATGFSWEPECGARLLCNRDGNVNDCGLSSVSCSGGSLSIPYWEDFWGVEIIMVKSFSLIHPDWGQTGTFLLMDKKQIPITVTRPPCDSWTYSDWGSCQSDGYKYREVLASWPAACVEDPPENQLRRSCKPLALEGFEEYYNGLDNTTARVGDITVFQIQARADSLLEGDPNYQFVNFEMDWDYKSSAPNFVFVGQRWLTQESEFRCQQFKDFPACTDGTVQMHYGKQWTVPGVYKVRVRCFGGDYQLCDTEKEATVTVLPPGEPCVYSTVTWGACQPNGTQTGTYTTSPASCTPGTPPATTRTCTYISPAASFNGFRTSLLGKIFSTFGIKMADDPASVRVKPSGDGKTFILVK